jgi:ribosomal protein S18 acetylase RimI-like enzyme
VVNRIMTLIRPATSRDRGTIRRLEMSCFGFERFLFGLWSRTGKQGVDAWVAETDGKPTGYLIAYSQKLTHIPIMYVGGVGVIPTYRKRGIASQLMSNVLMRYPELWLHVRASNTAATKLYIKLGMVVSQRLPHFYSDGDDALIMQTTGIKAD